MRFFGAPARDAPVYEEIEEAEIPVDAVCPFCGCVINDEDSGFLIPDVVSGQEEAYHDECLLEIILGPEVRDYIKRAELRTLELAFERTPREGGL